MDTEKRRALFNQMQMVIAGESVEYAMAATFDLMGAIVAFAADTPDHAAEILDLTAADLLRDIKANWDESRDARARAFLLRPDQLAGGVGHG